MYDIDANGVAKSRIVEFGIRNTSDKAIDHLKVMVSLDFTNKNTHYEQEVDLSEAIQGPGATTQGFLLPHSNAKYFVVTIPIKPEDFRADCVPSVKLTSVEDVKPSENYHDIKQFTMLLVYGKKEKILNEIKKDKSLINMQTKSGATPLMLACMNRDPELLDVLIKLGSNPKDKSKSGQNLLHFAAFSSPAMVKKVVSLGIKPCITLSGKFTPIEYAIDSNNWNTIPELVRAGVDINHRDNDGRTALIQSADWEFVEHCKQLVDLGADPLIEDNEGYTFGTFALLHKNPQVWEYALKVQGNIDHTNKNGLTLAHQMAMMTKAREFAWLVRKGASLTIQDKLGHTPYWYATNSIYPPNLQTMSAILEELRKEGVKLPSN